LKEVKVLCYKRSLEPQEFIAGMVGPARTIGLSPFTNCSMEFPTVQECDATEVKS
jgi:hypothetical protein